MIDKNYIKTRGGIFVPSVYMDAAYEGASTSRRMRTWGLSSYGPNTLLAGSLDNLRYRSRDLTRNDPTADGGIGSFVSDLIGSGVTPRWQTGDKGLNQEILDLWKESVDEIDHDGVLSFYGQQALVARALLESGEVLAQFKYPVDKNLLVPFQLQLIETDHLKSDMDTILESGNKLKQGVEFDRRNRRVAYHVYKNHPGETFFLTEDTGMEAIRIKAADMKHIYKPLRPGQIRGRPWLATLITRLYMLGAYEDAELDRKKTAAMFAGFVETPPGEPGAAGLPGEHDDEYQDEEYVSLEPATMQYMKPGEKITFSQPADVGGNYEVWIKQQLHRIAKGLGITYEQLTGDLEGVNYSSIRAGLIGFRRFCRMIQNNIIIYQLCKPSAARWMDMVISSGLLTIRDYAENRRRYTRTKWYPEGWEWVDPVKTILGKILKARAGLTSRTREIAEMGGNIEEIDEEIRIENENADKNGFVFDTDARKTAKSGILQKAEDSTIGKGAE